MSEKSIKSCAQGLLLACAVTLLSACGGGGGGGGSTGGTSSSSSPSSVSATSAYSGTVAVGSPLSGAQIVLKDVNGNTVSTTADANGAFQFSAQNMSGITAPFMLKATGVLSGTTRTLYSAVAANASTAQTVNITPLTNAIVSQVVTSGDVDTAFATPSIISIITTSGLSQASDKVKKSVESVYVQLGLSTSFDPFKDTFTPNSQGQDKLYDLVKFTVVAGGSIKVQDKSSGKVTTILLTDTVVQVAAKKLDPVSTQIINYDFGSVSSLISKINSNTLTGSNFSSSFLWSGYNATDFVGMNIMPAIVNSGIQFKSYDFGSCDGGTGVCDGNFSVTSSSGRTGKFYMPIIWNGSNWQLYGDQSNFFYSFTQVASITAVGSSVTSSDFGIELQLDATSSDVGHPVMVYVCTGTKTNCDAPSALTLSANGSCAWFTYSNNQCTGYVPSSSAFVTKLNNSQSSYENGQLWIKIVKGANSTTFKPQLAYLTSSDLSSLVARSMSAINVSEIGTASFTVVPTTYEVDATLSNFGSVMIFDDYITNAMASSSSGKTVNITGLCSNAGSSVSTCQNSRSVITSLTQKFGDSVQPVEVWITYSH